MITAISITAILSYLFALGVKETLKNEGGQLAPLKFTSSPNTILFFAMLFTAPLQIAWGFRVVWRAIVLFLVQTKAKFVLWRMAKKKEKQNPELAEDLRKLMRRF